MTTLVVLFVVGVMMAFAGEHMSYELGTNCVNNKENAALNLMLRYGEVLTDTVTRPDGTVIEFYSASTGTYTVVQVTGENTGCMIGSGDGYTPGDIVPGYND